MGNVRSIKKDFIKQRFLNNTAFQHKYRKDAAAKAKARKMNFVVEKTKDKK